MFNFFGVLNFKIRKYNMGKMREAFWMIKNKSRQEYFHLLLKSTALFASKDNVILQVVKLSIEVNRRNNIRNQTVFKLSRYLTARMKNAIRIMTNHSRKRAGQIYRRKQQYFSGIKMS